MAAPIKITIYNEDDEALATYQRDIIPWGVLKKAIKISKKIDKDNIAEETIDELASFICEIFGNKFTVEDIDKGADISEMKTVLSAILSRAGGLMPPNA